MKIIRNHTNEIRKAIKQLRNKIPKDKAQVYAALLSLDSVLNRMIDYSRQIQITFEVADTTTIPENKLQDLIDEGKEILEEFNQHEDRLDKLRGTMP